jgi:hypothetical protein
MYRPPCKQLRKHYSQTEKEKNARSNYPRTPLSNAMAAGAVKKIYGKDTVLAKMSSKKDFECV